MRTFTVFLVCIAIAATCACSNPKAIRFKDKESVGAVMDQIKNSKGLTVEEVQLLQGYLMRYTMAEGLKGFAGKNELPLEGKTVGELIDLQRKWADDVKTEEAKQKKLAEEAKAREEAMATELRKYITLTVYKKGYQPSNWSDGEYEDRITYGMTYQNNSPKDIRAFQGKVQFQDLFGDKVMDLNLKITDPISAGAQANWEGSSKFNQFKDEHTKLRNAELKDLKVVWIPEQIIFADGTTFPPAKEAR